MPSKKFSFKPKERELSFRKYYAYDTGFLSYKRTAFSEDFGRLMENVVAIELKRHGFEILHYLADNRYEVDFAADKEIIQVVYDEKSMPDREEKSGLKACKELKYKKLTIITWNKEGTKKINGTQIIYTPLWRWLLLAALLLFPINF